MTSRTTPDIEALWDRVAKRLAEKGIGLAEVIKLADGEEPPKSQPLGLRVRIRAAIAAGAHTPKEIHARLSDVTRSRLNVNLNAAAYDGALRKVGSGPQAKYFLKENQ